jgi:DNA polymerase I-like protein with 3'-5' exonuclease and polymerase domains
MKTITHSIADRPVTVNVVQTADDLDGFRDFIRKNLKALGCDSETTGLDIYSDSFKCRLVQFGNRSESWVVPVEFGGIFVDVVRQALLGVDRLIFQNASYDLQVFDRCFGVPMEKLWPKVTDTKILAHLVDPRGKDEGGTGHSLEDLTRKYIDVSVADSVKTLMKTLASDTGSKVADIWKTVELDHPDYLLYAGIDPILAATLVGKLSPLIPSVSNNLIDYEHKLAEVCSFMERTGFLLDIEYAKNLAESLHDSELAYTWKAGQMGCENVNSTDQVASVLESRGVKITGRTPTGRKKVDKVLLERLVDEGDEFAHAVVEAKKSRKWRTTWVDGFLNQADSNNRCHASINPLRARTARMSITGIPAQTLPAGDWLVRRCFVADPGQVMASVDYQAQELRVLAGLSGDPTMQRAFIENDDLHQITADASGVSRKIGKMVNFAYVYGSGPKNIALQADIDLATAKKVIAGFESAYPKVKELSKRLTREATIKGYITTPSGRVLPVDQNRPYAALNYMVQSASRDITAGGLIRLHKAGFTPYLRLPIHDEILVSLPTAKASWGASEVGKLMSTTFRGVSIDTSAEVGGKSWGSLYGSEY